MERRLRFALNAGRLGLWELDLRTGVMTSSRYFRETFGRDPAEPFPYEALLAAVHPDDRAHRDDALAHSIATGEDYQIEYRVLRPDGRVGWVQVSAQVVRSPDAVPTHMAGTSMDITERRESEARTQVLLELDARLDELEDPDELAFAAAEMLGRTLGVSRVGYGTVNLKNETITIARDWNAPGIRSLAGTLQFRDYGSYIDDLKRGDTVVFVDADLDPRTAATADALKAISAQALVNMPVTERDGLVALLYLNHATRREWLADELGFIREVAHRTHVAVERRRVEQELRALASTLEAKVVERTTALMAAEAALHQAQKMEAVGQLTGGLAHDFNNLLTGISGALELIRRRQAGGTLTDDTLLRYVSMAQGATGRAAALTHRLLAFSRQQTLAPEPTDVNRLVAGLRELIQHTVGPSIAIEVTAESQLWGTLVDPSQLESALLNLCINARDAMPDGGRLSIETRNRELDADQAKALGLPAGAYVALCVSDSGVGMSPQVMAKAFDPFFTTKPIGQGTGLGLSMIYGFVRQSGGLAQIDSTPGVGTSVCLLLPRQALPADTADPQDPASIAPQAAPGERLLVVDDDASVRAIACELLKESGYMVLEAQDGMAAIDILQSDIPLDLLVTDVGLPGGMNGRQLANAARAVRPGLKVLFITGYAEQAVMGDGQLDAGMQILTKPFALDALAKRVKQLTGSA
ncbi:response regulator [Pigmentiphaga aceris]|nr:response regulator [Pigmentiphaga aceris]